MNVTLPADVENYIEQSVRNGAFGSASEFVEAAARRQMQEEAWFEQKVLAGLAGPVTPLTPEDLDPVRDIVRSARDLANRATSPVAAARNTRHATVRRS